MVLRLVRKQQDFSRCDGGQCGNRGNVVGHRRELTPDSRITADSAPLGFYSGLCPPPCSSSFTASTRLARHAGSPLSTRVTTRGSTTTEPDTSESLGETWPMSGGPWVAGKPSKRGEPTWPPATQANARPHIHPNGKSDNPIPLTPGTRRRRLATSP